MKGILLLLSTVVLLSFVSRPNYGVKANEDALILSQDQDFCNIFNSIINFTYSFKKEKKSELIRDYASKSITDEKLKELLKISGFKSKEELNNFFTSINQMNKSISNKYDFLNDKENSKNTVKEASVLAWKNGKLTKVVKLPEDCLISLMAALAVCYAAYDNCWAGGGGDYCVALWSACITLAWNGYDQCVGPA